MTDIAQASVAMLWTRLDQLVTLAPVYQHPPKDAVWPLVFIAPPSVIDGGSKIGALADMSVTIYTAVAATEIAPINAIMAEIVAALDRYRPGPVDGVSFGVVKIDSQTAGIDESGVSYTGQQIARFLAFD